MDNRADVFFPERFSLMVQSGEERIFKVLVVKTPGPEESTHRLGRP